MENEEVNRCPEEEEKNKAYSSIQHSHTTPDSNNQQ